jgi:hypothetical protein
MRSRRAGVVKPRLMRVVSNAIKPASITVTARTICCSR